MLDAPAIGGLSLFHLLIATAIGILLGAICLRPAIRLYNKMAGGVTSSKSVPEPGFAKAMGIICVIISVNTVLSFLFGVVIGVAAEGAGAGAEGVYVVAELIYFPFGLVIMGAMLSRMLPTTFGRAVLVSLCHMLVTIAVAGILILVAIVVLWIACQTL